jgi:hypothetical protein
MHPRTSPSASTPTSAPPRSTRTPDPVLVRITFSRTGPQRVPGFVERAGTDRVYAHFVHMGFVHHAWTMRDQVTHRQLKPRRAD